MSNFMQIFSKSLKKEDINDFSSSFLNDELSTKGITISVPPSFDKLKINSISI